ncbi:MAG: hypothetical protein QM796_11700 [Chthoniobacteraceae bacterium]
MKRFVKTPYPAGPYADQYGTRYQVQEVEADEAVRSPYQPQVAANLQEFLAANGLSGWNHRI